MDKDNSYTISFGAFDSELKGWEYTIPEGMEAEIKNGKIIVREKESEDERIRKQLLNWFKDCHWDAIDEDKTPLKRDDIIAWFERQGSQNLANSAKTCKNEQTPAWSEEDEIGFCDAMWAIEQARTIAKDENDMGNLWYAERWLKSLKERYTWKPSDEQMKQLGLIVELNKDNLIGEGLMTLFNDLKKLKG